MLTDENEARAIGLFEVTPDVHQEHSDNLRLSSASNSLVYKAFDSLSCLAHSFEVALAASPVSTAVVVRSASYFSCVTCRSSWC